MDTKWNNPILLSPSYQDSILCTSLAIYQNLLPKFRKCWNGKKVNKFTSVQSKYYDNYVMQSERIDKTEKKTV